MPRIIIVDGEANARTSLRKTITHQYPEARVIGEANSVTDGVSIIRKNNPDVVFLAAQMKDGTGFDLLNHFHTSEFGVIFTAAVDRYALKAFKYNAIDYLIKPLNPIEVRKALGKYQANRERQLHSGTNYQPEKIFQTHEFEKIALSTNGSLIFLRLKELIRLESCSCYTTFYTNKGHKVMVSRTLREFEELLPSDIFFRTHQSHIININYVHSVLKADSGCALMEDQSRVPVSRRKKDAFLERLTAISIF